MKMEHEVRAQAAGLVREVPVAAGATVQAGAVLVVLEESPDDVAEPARANDVALDHVRPDLAEVRERHRIGLDEGLPRRPGGGTRPGGGRPGRTSPTWSMRAASPSTAR